MHHGCGPYLFAPRRLVDVDLSQRTAIEPDSATTTFLRHGPSRSSDTGSVKLPRFCRSTVGLSIVRVCDDGGARDDDQKREHYSVVALHAMRSTISSTRTESLVRL